MLHFTQNGVSKDFKMAVKHRSNFTDRNNLPLINPTLFVESKNVSRKTQLQLASDVEFYPAKNYSVEGIFERFEYLLTKYSSIELLEQSESYLSVANSPYDSVKEVPVSRISRTKLEAAAFGQALRHQRIKVMLTRICKGKGGLFG